MRLSIQRLRWVLVAGALLLVAVLAVYIGYGHYRMMSAYRRILARSGATISRDSKGVTYSQSLGGKKIFTLRAARETSLGDGRWTLHDADLLLYTRDPDRPDHIYGKDFEYDQKEGVARALGEVFMDLQAPDALAGTGHAGAPAVHGEAGSPATAGPKPAQVIHVRTSGLVYTRKLGVAATDQEVEFAYGGMQCSALGAEFNTGQNVLHLLARVKMDGMEHGQPVHLTAQKADIDRTANEVNLAQPVMMSEDRKAGGGKVQERKVSAERAVLNLRKDGSIEQGQGFGNVVLASGTRQVTAQQMDATLSPESVPETARLSGNVALVDTDPQRPMRGAARQVDAVFDAQGAAKSVVATGAAGGVASLAMVDHADAAAGSHGLEREIAGEKIVALFASGGRVASSRTAGSGTAGSRTAGSRLSEVQATGGAQMRGESLITVASGAKARLAGPPQQLAAQGRAPQFKTVQVAADDLRMLFVAAGDKQVQPQRLMGTGHTVLQQDAPLGEQEISRGATLEATFAASDAPGPGANAGKQPLTVASAVQTGQVTIYTRAASRAAGRQPVPVGGELAARNRGAGNSTASGLGVEGGVSTGSAQRAIYDGAARTVTLAGDTRLASGEVSLLAPTVALDEVTGNAEARGGVQTTMLGAATAPPGASGAEVRPAAVTHVLSASATFDHARKLSEFRGSEAEPAKMWQDASQVQAGVLVLDGLRHTFSARPAGPGGLVRAVFAGGPGAATTKAKGVEKAHEGRQRPGPPSDRAAATDYVRVASPKMDYNDLMREATFSGGVQIDGTIGEVRGQRAVVFLTPAAKGAPAAQAGGSPRQPLAAGQSGPLGGSLDRVVVSGDVRMEQPGRQGTGEQLLYIAGTGTAGTGAAGTGAGGPGTAVAGTPGAGNYVLTGSPGHPPHIVDAQQGSITGETLLFSGAGSTIVVAGAPGAPKSGQGRVRTETEVRQ